ncbi:MAG: primosomal protein N' [Candidatus Latescibacteria bacterium]|nr:primosomal protein N' [Candidatus Latescibacterota bacterium]
MEPLYAEVAVPAPRTSPFTYRIPEGLQGRVQEGIRVVVPLGGRQVTGVVVGLSEACDLPEVREVLEVLDERPAFDRGMLDFCRWVADYYLCGWGEALRTALPAGISVGSSRNLVLASRYARATAEDLHLRTVEEREVFASLASGGRVGVEALRRKYGAAVSRRVIAALSRAGIAEVRSEAQGPRTQVKQERVALLASSDPRWVEVESGALDRRAPRQAACLRLLAARGGRASAATLAGEGIGGEILRALVRRQFVKIVTEEVERDPYGDAAFDAPEARTPTPEQAEVIRDLERSIASKAFHVALLHGVTGSGKTFVYLRAIERTLAGGQGAILLVPEIGLTAQTVRPFRGRFGDAVAVLHSALSDGERYDMWRSVLRGERRVVIGTRSAIFAPVRDLGLIVLDEEHDPSYKEHDRDPRYHARDAAVMRAKLCGAVALLGSATPSLESEGNGRSGKFARLRLPHRIDHRPLPPVTLVDMRQEGGGGVIFSKPLRERIKARLRAGERILLLQNRRGYAPFVQCSDCGEAVRCRNCAVTMTFHAPRRRMVCHYCGMSSAAPTACPSCQGPGLRYGGIGTQRVEEALLAQFPGVRVLRMDVDTTRRKGSHDRLLDAFRRGEADVLLGTQMVAKGLDFPGVTLVGVISADTALHMPDFRAPERTFQLLTQVAGRSGRGERPGEVVIQTYRPDDDAIRAACAHDFDAFAERELGNRRPLGYPPFGRLIAFLFRGREEAGVTVEAGACADHLRHVAPEAGVEVLGPAAAPLARLKGEFRWQIVLKGAAPTALRRLAREAIDRFGTRPRPGVRMSVDVDPVSLL